MLRTLKGLALNILPRSVQGVFSYPVIFDPCVPSLLQRSLSTSPSALSCSKGLALGQWSHKRLQPWASQSSTILSWSHLPTSAPPSNVGGYLIPSRGMKVKGRVKRRCKDCYFIWIDGCLQNLCKSQPRHKQRLKPMYWANSRILTHASSSPKRPW